MFSLGITLVSLWSHLFSLGFTRSRLISLGLTWFHLVSLGVICSVMASLGLTWHRWTQGKRAKAPSQKETGNGIRRPLGFRFEYKSKRRSPAKRDKGTGADTHWASELTLPPDTPRGARAHARTNETKRFPGKFQPPTSDHA